MIEFVATVVITVSSVLLFGYWFRYTCLLILSAKTTRDFASEVAAENQLGFASVQEQLHANPDNLDRLRDLLDRDYAVLKRLLNQAGPKAEQWGIEIRMLSLNYRVIKAWFNVSSRFSPAAARKALEEMALTVAYFANATGERTLSAA
jgi:hypothetical protein